MYMLTGEGFKVVHVCGLAVRSAWRLYICMYVCPPYYICMSVCSELVYTEDAVLPLS